MSNYNRDPSAISSELFIVIFRNDGNGRVDTIEVIIGRSCSRVVVQHALLRAESGNADNMTSEAESFHKNHLAPDHRNPTLPNEFHGKYPSPSNRMLLAITFSRA